MKNYKSLLVIMLSLMLVVTGLATGVSASELTPVGVHGQLSVSGTKIVDENGNAVQLHGISTHGINWDVGYPFVNEAAFKELRDGWGVNAVRLAMYTTEYNGYCAGGDQNGLKTTIHNGVTYATNLGMYAIIDWHILNDGNPLTNMETAKTFWNEMSAKYNSYNNVLYEICNEPNGCSWDDIKTYANTIIPIIRANDPDAIIIVGTPTWSQLGSSGTSNEVADSPLTGYSNIMYTLHFYCNESAHSQYLPAKVEYAMNKGVPIIVSEFGLSAANGTDGINTSQAEVWFDLLDKYDIGYFCWSLSNKNETSALISNSCYKTSGWSTYELSSAGQYIKSEYYSRRDTRVNAGTTGGTTTEAPTVATTVSNTGTISFSDSGWWTEQEISMSELLGNVAPEDVVSIKFSGNTDFAVAYNSTSTGGYLQLKNQAQYTVTDLNFNDYYLRLCLSKADGINYTFTWEVYTAVAEEPTTQVPTEAPTQAPTEAPTEAPTQAPTEAPTEAPTQAPTEAPDTSNKLVEDFVERLYVNVLGRDSEEAGKANWVNALVTGNSNGMKAGYGFVFSAECELRNLSDEEFVEMLYETFMDRASDSTGKEIWVGQLKAGIDREKVFAEFVMSAEFGIICNDYKINSGNISDVEGLQDILTKYHNQNANITQFVARCYTEVFNREYDESGLDLWCGMIIEKQYTPKQVAQYFVNSEEFSLKNLSNREYVKVLYRTFFGREADNDGLNLWTAILDANAMTKETVLNNFADSQEFVIILQGFGLN